MIFSDELDPITGLRTRMAFEDGKLCVNYAQDISLALDRNTKLRNAEGYAKQGIKDNFQHVAHIPDSVCLKIKSEGVIDPFKCTPKELKNYLVKNRDKYGYLFTTAGRV